MEKEPKIKNKEIFERVRLSIEEPRMDKNFMISFEAKNKAQNKVYNRAIEEVCKARNLHPFHQVGSFEETGYQAWEMWIDVDRKMLGGLFPEIHDKAEETYKNYKKWGMLEDD